jgi:hypothetical protein
MHHGCDSIVIVTCCKQLDFTAMAEALQGIFSMHIHTGPLIQISSTIINGKEVFMVIDATTSYTA